MLKHTILYPEHMALHAKMVNFAGWEMPIHYGSQLEEHHQVRRHAGVFDVSHMNVMEIVGEDAQSFLRYLLANDVAKLKNPGKALYTCLLNEAGGILDDLIVYYLQPNHYRLVLNAATREKDIAWIKKHALSYRVTVNVQENLSVLALQGPQAFQILESAFGPLLFEQLAALKPFQFTIFNDIMFARTGYTGEEGFEIILPAAEAVMLWRKLLSLGAKPIGLGARDTLRLEAGFHLYGADMDESTSPLESNLAWTVSLDDGDRQFIGKKALCALKDSGINRFFVGILLEKGGVLRQGQELFLDNVAIGEITSGGFSPTLNYAIGMGRVSRSDLKACEVKLRDKLLPVKIVSPGFVRKGKSLVD